MRTQNSGGQTGTWGPRRRGPQIQSMSKKKNAKQALPSSSIATLPSTERLNSHTAHLHDIGKAKKGASEAKCQPMPPRKETVGRKPAWTSAWWRYFQLQEENPSKRKKHGLYDRQDRCFNGTDMENIRRKTKARDISVSKPSAWVNL